MPMTMTQKIIAAHCGLNEVKAEQLVMVDVDLVLGNDITSPIAIREFEKSGRGDVFDREKIALVMDHFTPNKDIKAAQQCLEVRYFAHKYNIKNFFDVGQMGIEHALLPEKGLVKSGNLIIGADSHTCTYGALGAFSAGVGSTDMAYAMITGKVWLKVPSAIKFVFRNSLKGWASGKDVILSIIGQIGVSGAGYKSMEFCGDISGLSMDDRLCIANMAIEAGAKNGIFTVDEKTKEYEKEKGNASVIYEADNDAVYEKVYEIDLSEIRPSVAFPHSPENVRAVDDVTEDIEIDQVVIGSCTNGRLEDLKIAASVLKDRKVGKNCRVIIIPGTQKIYLDALKLGYIQTFIEAGCAVSTPTCGPCLGGHMGILANGEKAVSTTNRNFVGRMGHTQSEVYLASPAVAAATAAAGKLTSPERIGL